MGDLQAWFQPLLWVIGTITAVICFIKLILPLFRTLMAPVKLQSTVEGYIANISNKMDGLGTRLDSIDDEIAKLLEKIEAEEEVELALLHDAIVQIYHFSKAQGKVYPEDYARACELYKYNGKSKYMATIMEELTALYKKSVGV